MTVSTTTNTVVYRGNGAVTQFAVPFLVLDEDHLVVKRRVYDTQVVDTTYTGTDYSYAGVGDPAGTLTLAGTALDDDYEVIIQRIVPYSQDLDIVNAGGFYPDTVEEQLDLLEMQIQQVNDKAERSIKVPPGKTVTDVVDYAGMYLAFDALGQPVPSAGTGTDSGLRADLASGVSGTALIAWQASGADPVLRTLHDWISDQAVNVKDYGAVGDGTTIDTVAVNLAITACSAGQTLYFPASSGEYMIDGSDAQSVPGIGDVSTVPLPVGVNVLMDGGAWLKRAQGDPDDGTAYGPIFLTALGDNILQVNIDGDEYPLVGGMTGTWRSDGGVGVFGVNASNVTLQNCRFRNITYCVETQGPTQWKIDKCEFYRTRLSGCYLVGNDASGCARVKVTDSHFEEMGDTAVAFHYLTDTAVVAWNIVDNCTAKNTNLREDGYAFDIEGATNPGTHHHNTFSNLKVEQVTNSAFVQGGVTMNANVSDGEIINCILVGNGDLSSPGIAITNSDNIRVEGNRIENFGGGAISKVGATDAIVRNNVGYKTENWGTSAAIATGATIAHGLAEAPTSWSATPTTTGATDVWVSADATNLTVNFGGGGSHAFAWEARV